MLLFVLFNIKCAHYMYHLNYISKTKILYMILRIKKMYVSMSTLELKVIQTLRMKYVF